MLVLASYWATGQAQQAEERPLSMSASQSFAFDDNVLRLPAGVDPFSIDGVSARRDMISTTMLRANYLNTISAQRVNAWAEARSVRFSDHDQFSHLGWDLGVRWNWEAGRQWYGLFSAQERRFLGALADQQSGQRNLVNVTDLRFDAGFRLSSRWSIVGGIDGSQRRNDLGPLKQSDYRHTGYEAGVRYDSGVGNDLALVLRRVDGRYPNRQVTDSLGNPLPTIVDNGFEQGSLLFRLQYQPNDKSRLNAEAGFTRHRLATFGERDFRGPTARLAYTYTPSDAWLFESYLRRDLGSAELVNASFVDSRTLGGRLIWRPKARLTVQGFAEARRLSFDGDPGSVLLPLAVRKDSIRSTGLAIGWEVARNASVWSEWRKDRRTSNYDQVDFDADIVTLTGQLKF